MKRFISTKHEINAPIEKVWAKIAQGDQVETWIPIIKSSKRVDSTRRFCEMHEGGSLEETILASDGTKTFMYSIDKQDAFPAKNITGTIKLEKKGEDQTILFWDLELEPTDESAYPELSATIEQIYQMSAAKLAQVA